MSIKKASKFLAPALLLASINTAPAALLNPLDYSSLGTLAGGPLVFDTDALTVGGLSGTLQAQSGGPDIAVFTFGDGSILGNATITGSRPLAILFQGGATLNGSIDVSGANGGDDPSNAAYSTSGGTGLAGGGSGGTGGAGIYGGTDGSGPGGGQLGAAGSSGGSGSGAGFGTDGGSTGASVTLRLGGSAYGDPLRDTLQGGSGGGGGGSQGSINPFGGTGGGAGGGAIEIGALSLLELTGVSLLANGGRGGDEGASGLGFAGGGGSGGGILLHAFDVNIDGGTLLQANGGRGGMIPTLSGALLVDGGCGGAGRIEIVTNTAGTLSMNGTAEAIGAANPPGTGSCTDSALVNTALPDVGQGSAPNGVPAPGGLWLLLAGIAAMRIRHRAR